MQNIPFVHCNIKHVVDVNSKNMYGETPLILAVRLNDYVLVRLLLQNGADAKEESVGVYPVFQALYNNNYEIFDLLLQQYTGDYGYDASYRITDSESNTVMIF